jgi:hypothetical protein
VIVGQLIGIARIKFMTTLLLQSCGRCVEEKIRETLCCMGIAVAM